jgi:hypothetical protein
VGERPYPIPARLDVEYLRGDDAIPFRGPPVTAVFRTFDSGLHVGKLKLEYDTFRVCDVAETWPIGSLEIISVLEISTDQTFNWAIRVEGHRKEASPSQISSQGPGKFNEVVEITAINEIRFGHSAALAEWQEDKWVFSVGRTAYHAYASIFRMLHKQFNLKWLQSPNRGKFRRGDFNACAF